MSDKTGEVMARAMRNEIDRYADGEGPFGCFDYSYNNPNRPEQPHCIRDFRIGAKPYGKIVARFADSKEAYIRYELLCDQHFIEAALAALEQAGYVVVPKEPTDEMCLAGYNAGTGDWGGHYDNDREVSRGRSAPAYRAMISASKTAKEG